jgi:hypothetical protein
MGEAHKVCCKFEVCVDCFHIEQAGSPGTDSAGTYEYAKEKERERERHKGACAILAHEAYTICGSPSQPRDPTSDSWGRREQQSSHYRHSSDSLQSQSRVVLVVPPLGSQAICDAPVSPAISFRGLCPRCPWCFPSHISPGRPSEIRQQQRPSGPVVQIRRQRRSSTSGTSGAQSSRSSTSGQRQTTPPGRAVGRQSRAGFALSLFAISLSPPLMSNRPSYES